MLVHILLIIIAMSACAFAQHKDSNGWRKVLDGVDGYPAGQVVEVALRRSQDDKNEFFKLRSEFIAMLGAHSGFLKGREWKSLEAMPSLTGAGTWTGMGIWANMQAFHDFANNVFPTQVTANWVATMNTTFGHVRPEQDFPFDTLAQSGDEVLEFGILAYPAKKKTWFKTQLDLYRAAIESAGATGTYTFEFYSNGEINGPLTVHYNANGPPSSDGSEMWKVYMAVWPSHATYTQAMIDKRRQLKKLKASTVWEHSSIDVATRTTNRVCCKKETNKCEVDPEKCDVGRLGSGDTWAPNCALCPKPCRTSYGALSDLNPQKCLAVGGEVVNNQD